MDPAAATRADGLRRVELFGLDFVDDTSIDPIVELVTTRDPATVDGLPMVVTPNTDLMVQIDREPDQSMRELFRRVWCVLPDGQPIVWASRLLGVPLRFRLTGSDLFARLWPEVIERDTRSVVVAPNGEVAAGIEASHPGATALVAPMLDPTSADQLDAFAADVAATVTATASRIVVMSLGHPKDSLVGKRVIERLAADGEPLPFVLCLGGSAEMYLGIRKRAPVWVQRLSAEWLYRFAQEPRRLFTRYFVRDVAFVGIVRRERAARRRRTTAAAA